MLSIVAASSAYQGLAMRAPASAVRMSALDDLKALAKEQNPVVGYYDPLNGNAQLLGSG